MRFLSGPGIQAQVRRLASRSGEVMAAVAYWGKGASERTGLTDNDRPAGVRVICDLLSGACNPVEIETLVSLGVSVRTLDRLHAKVWIAGDNIIVGSANASHNGLPGDDDEAAGASIEAAVLSRDPLLARQLAAWFEEQWCASSKIEQWHLDQARDIWSRRRRTGGRGFTTPLTDKLRQPDLFDRFAGLRLLAYLGENVSQEAAKFVEENYGGYFTDEEWQDFGDDNPWYEWCLGHPEWGHPPGTVFADFSRASKSEEFTFNGFWQIRDCPDIKLKKVRLTLLTKHPHFNGYSLSPEEQVAIARRIQEVVAERNHEPDDFGSYIDENLLEFWDPDRDELRQRLLAQIAQAAQELCRSDQFAPDLTLHAIRVCKEDPEWLAGYARFVGGDIYGDHNPLKRRINPDFGSRVKDAVGAEDRKDGNGNPVSRRVKNEIIQSYTLFEGYDPQALESS